MQNYVTEILSAEEKTRNMRELVDQMSELAVADTLTGIRNKNACQMELQKLEQALQSRFYSLTLIDRTLPPLRNAGNMKPPSSAAPKKKATPAARR